MEGAVMDGGFSYSNTVRIGRDTRPAWADIVRMADTAITQLHLVHPGGFFDLDVLWTGAKQLHIAALKLIGTDALDHSPLH